MNAVEYFAGIVLVGGLLGVPVFGWWTLVAAIVFLAGVAAAVIKLTPPSPYRLPPRK